VAKSDLNIKRERWRAEDNSKEMKMTNKEKKKEEDDSFEKKRKDKKKGWGSMECGMGKKGKNHWMWFEESFSFL